MSSTSRARLAVAAVAVGGGVGGAVLCLALLAAHDLPRGPDSPMADLVLGAGAAGIVGAAAAAFGVARSLGVFRAMMAGMVSISGAAMFGVLTVPADAALGRAGLAGLLALCLLSIFAGWRLQRSAGVSA